MHLISFRIFISRLHFANEFNFLLLSRLSDNYRGVERGGVFFKFFAFKFFEFRNSSEIIGHVLLVAKGFKGGRKGWKFLLTTLLSAGEKYLLPKNFERNTID